MVQGRLCSNENISMVIILLYFLYFYFSLLLLPFQWNNLNFQFSKTNTKSFFLSFHLTSLKNISVISPRNAFDNKKKKLKVSSLPAQRIIKYIYINFYPAVYFAVESFHKNKNPPKIRK